MNNISTQSISSDVIHLTTNRRINISTYLICVHVLYYYYYYYYRYLYSGIIIFSSRLEAHVHKTEITYKYEMSKIEYSAYANPERRNTQGHITDRRTDYVSMMPKAHRAVRSVIASRPNSRKETVTNSAVLYRTKVSL